jgi:Cu/Ag efflux protein CusF
MPRLIAPLALAAALTALPALAAEMTGTVKKADNGADTLLLADGTLFYLGEGASMKGLKPGTKVVVTFDVQAGVKIATGIKAQK